MSWQYIIAISIVSFGVLVMLYRCVYAIGYNSGCEDTAQRWRNVVVEHGHAGYNRESGKWEWNKS